MINIFKKNPKNYFCTRRLIDKLFCALKFDTSKKIKTKKCLSYRNLIEIKYKKKCSLPHRWRCYRACSKEIKSQNGIFFEI